MDRVTAAATPSAEEFFDPALVEESAKKSGLLWVAADGQGPGRPLWHAWQGGAVVVVGDGGEQPLHGLVGGGTAVVTVRSKDKGGRLVRWPARVVEPAPGSEAWQAAVDELKGKRLNAPDTDTVTDRWARECRVLRLEPAGATTQRPGAMPDTSHAAQPVPTPATTRHPAPAGLPKLLFRRRRP
ncbi:hypothetical protein ACIQGZ_05870 [Streptomyces sp. NPDC092296]|uniref:hypothetical protein n=1 Tax=Streptomyces sp. NPDC092296 TaxID=3366012 RepID=UPI00382339E1